MTAPTLREAMARLCNAVDAPALKSHRGRAWNEVRAADAAARAALAAPDEGRAERIEKAVTEYLAAFDATGDLHDCLRREWLALAALRASVLPAPASPEPDGERALRCAVCHCGWTEGSYDPDCECRCHRDPTYKPTERVPHPPPASPPSPAPARAMVCPMPVCARHPTEPHRLFGDLNRCSVCGEPGTLLMDATMIEELRPAPSPAPAKPCPHWDREATAVPGVEACLDCRAILTEIPAPSPAPRPVDWNEMAREATRDLVAHLNSLPSAEPAPSPAPEAAHGEKCATCNGGEVTFGFVSPYCCPTCGGSGRKL